MIEYQYRLIKGTPSGPVSKTGKVRAESPYKAAHKILPGARFIRGHATKREPDVYEVMSKDGQFVHTLYLTDMYDYKKNPTKRKRATPSRVARKTRTPAQKAATARMLAANKAKRAGTKWKAGKRTPAQRSARKRTNTVAGYYPNPQRKIARKPRKVTVFEKYSGGLKNTKQRGRNRLIGNSFAKYCVQVARNGKWVTLAQFGSKDAAADYGRALQRKYKSHSFRVYWP